LASFAHDHNLLLHMDGARISNAAVALGVSFRQLTVNAGVDDGRAGHYICAYGRFGFDFINADTRVMSPLKRIDGELKPITWDEAYATAADLLRSPSDTGIVTTGNLLNEDILTLRRFAGTTGIKDIDSSFNGADYIMSAAVNIGSEDALWPCNAYWDGYGINMFSAGGGCSATDQMADVIYHEYQHGITQFAYDPFDSPYTSGMGEGFSDYTGMTLRNSPCLGDAFFGTPGGCLRNGENVRWRCREDYG